MSSWLRCMVSKKKCLLEPRADLGVEVSALTSVKHTHLSPWVALNGRTAVKLPCSLNGDGQFLFFFLSSCQHNHYSYFCIFLFLGGVDYLLINGSKSQAPVLKTVPEVRAKFRHQDIHVFCRFCVKKVILRTLEIQLLSQTNTLGLNRFVEDETLVITVTDIFFSNCIILKAKLFDWRIFHMF